MPAALAETLAAAGVWAVYSLTVLPPATIWAGLVYVRGRLAARRGA